MKLSWALISVWTSASTRRGPFARGFSSSARLGRTTARSSSRGTSSSTSSEGHRTTTLNPSKRPRDEYASRSMRSPREEERRGLSPHELKTGRRISLCPKCLGEGKVRATLSKKARARRKRTRQSDGSADARRPGPATKPCRGCDGSGLIAAALPPPPPAESGGGEGGGEPEAEAGARPPPAVREGVSVAIVGGGVGGVALAAALRHRNVPCVVYERDASFEERRQGYGLTMQQGARALRALGFFASRFEDGAEEEEFGIHSKRHVVHKPDGTVVGEWGMKVWGGRFERGGRKHARRQNAHVSRQNLRKMLLDALPPGTVRWGCKFLGYERSPRGSEGDGEGDGSPPRLRLTFERRRAAADEGTEEATYETFAADATVVVGCDGIRSAVRADKLGDAAPLRYLGCVVILGIAPSPDSPLTDGETVFQTADGVARIYAMPFARPGEETSAVAGGVFRGGSGDRGLSMWQLSFPVEESDATRLSRGGPSALKAEAVRRCGRWHDPIPELLSRTPEGLVTGYPCYDRALVDRELFREGCHAHPREDNGASFVTMLGDAAHPMSPFKGQGANQALLDAVLLARKLYGAVSLDSNKPKKDDSAISLGERIATSLAEFEEEMLERSTVKVQKSADAAKFLHTHVAISEGNVTRGAAARDDSMGKETSNS
ncbi:hypothetical protein ACHAWF_003161 [Thalassiosira exigua]